MGNCFARGKFFFTFEALLMRRASLLSSCWASIMCQDIRTLHRSHLYFSFLVKPYNSLFPPFHRVILVICPRLYIKQMAEAFYALRIKRLQNGEIFAVFWSTTKVTASLFCFHTENMNILLDLLRATFVGHEIICKFLWLKILDFCLIPAATCHLPESVLEWSWVFINEKLIPKVSNPAV